MTFVPLHENTEAVPRVFERSSIRLVSTVLCYVDLLNDFPDVQCPAD